jgi:hypothetical protein
LCTCACLCTNSFKNSKNEGCQKTLLEKNRFRNLAAPKEFSYRADNDHQSDEKYCHGRYGK